MSALVLTTDSVPENLRIIENLGMFQLTHPIEVGNKGIIRGLMERSRNEHQEAFDAFVAGAPTRANLIYGVRISTAVGTLADKTLLYITYIATAARCEEKGSRP